MSTLSTLGARMPGSPPVLTSTGRRAAAAGAVLVAAGALVLASGCSSSSTSAPHAATGSASQATGGTTAPAPGTSSASPSPAATGKLTGAAATALAAKAVANTRAASSVQVTGQGISSSAAKGQDVSFGLLLVKNQGCSGTISVSKTQTFKIVQAGGYIWLMPSAAFYQSLHLSKQAMALVANKYIKVKASDKRLGSVTRMCTFNGLFSSLPKPTGQNFTAIPVSYQGAPAYQITRSGKTGIATVSNTVTPLLLKITAAQAGGGAITFADYNSAKTITAPSAAESIDGSQLGI
jgi:hypothetical protein